jgi:hypothetical protein
MLEFPDLVRKCWLGHGKLRGRVGEMKIVGYGQEVLELPELDVGGPYIHVALLSKK